MERSLTGTLYVVSDYMNYVKPILGFGGVLLNRSLCFQDMIYDVASLYADLIKAAFFPSCPAVLSISSKEKQTSSWQSPADGVGAWLPSCVRHVRYKVAPASQNRRNIKTVITVYSRIQYGTCVPNLAVSSALSELSHKPLNRIKRYWYL